MRHDVVVCPMPEVCHVRKHHAMSKITDITQETAALRIKDALQLRVGRWKRYNFSSLASATDIPQRTVESYVQGATPGLHNLLRLCAALGPSFTSDILSACGQEARATDPDAPEHVKVMGMMGGMVSAVSDALADGHVDHREAAQMRPMAAELIEALQPLAKGVKG